MNNMNSLANIAGGVLVIALVTTVVARPNSAAVIRAIGSSFSEVIGAALGKGVRFSGA